MPVLPLIDLMIVVGWTSLFAGFVLKAIYITTHYRPLLIGLSPIDFLLIAVVSLLFALALAARSWVKANEPGLMMRRPMDPYAGQGRYVDDELRMRAPMDGYAAAGAAVDMRSGVVGREAGGIAHAPSASAAGSTAEVEPMGQRSGRSSAKAEAASSA